MTSRGLLNLSVPPFGRFLVISMQLSTMHFRTQAEQKVQSSSVMPTSPDFQ